MKIKLDPGAFMPEYAHRQDAGMDLRSPIEIVRVKLWNLGRETYEIMCGDKIAQLVVYPVLHPELEQVAELDETERGDNGFGSTGR